jgi:hypothetical protein
MSSAESQFLEWAVWTLVAASAYFITVCTLSAKWWRFRRYPVTTSAVAISLAILINLTPELLRYAFGFNVVRAPWLGWYTGAAMLFAALVEFWRGRVTWRLYRTSALPAEESEHPQPRTPSPSD